MSFPFIIERLDHDLPNDNKWWPLWMDGISLPSFLTAIRVGIFEALDANPHLSVDMLATKVDISI